jgi:hypothetical protein
MQYQEEENKEDIVDELTIGEVLADSLPKLFEKVLSDEGDIEIVKLRSFDLLV